MFSKESFAFATQLCFIRSPTYYSSFQYLTCLQKLWKKLCRIYDFVGEDPRPGGALLEQYTTTELK